MRDRDYYDGDQISDHVKAELKKRGQPQIFTNKIGPAMSGILGIIDAGESDPECHARTIRSQDSADTATKTLRYIADRTQYKTVRKQTSDNYFIHGTCAAITEWDGSKITVSRIRWEDLVYDPLSREHDFSDAKYLGIAKLMDVKDVAAMFPETYDSLGKPEGEAFDYLQTSTQTNWWRSGDRKQLRVVDLYYLVGTEWHRMIFCEAGELWAGPCEYVDDEGGSICPIAGTSFEIKQDNSRYGAIRNMIPLQDEVNARRSRLLHLVNHRQVRVSDPRVAVTKASEAAKEAAKADGVIPAGYEVVHSQDLAQGQMQIMQQSSIDLDRLAPTPSVLGRVASSSESGRARQMLQQAGYTELARAFGRFEAFEMAIYRRMWWAARQYLDAPTLIRIVDDPRAPEFLQINEPVMAEQMVPVMDPATGQPLIDPYTGQPVMQPQQVQVDTRNRLAELDMDIILTTVPDQTTQQAEVFEQLMNLAGSTGVSPFAPEFLAYLEMAPLSDKRATIERIQRLAQKASEQSAEAEQAAMQMAQAEKGAEISGKEAKAQKDQALARKAAMDAQKIEQEISRGVIPVITPPMPPGFGGQYFQGFE
ncbi:hypothetical protein OKW76_00450 [Sphingomonas sp. S1-29]|uniref:portal protein n=1 Tax=Sphingomonas sp. S1-29 TaxID=2991074 RepID=UPI00223EB0A0|nr:hypothetical protein [Sphingomonas sp. S1-29]UZK69595.1 hypothetical protein OKW76_00450 [Sphingomonas sp. S1-29]